MSTTRYEVVDARSGERLFPFTFFGSAPAFAWGVLNVSNNNWIVRRVG